MNDMIQIFTDGSCNPKYKIGAWCSVILLNNKKIELSGVELDVSHNEMELCAVLKSLEHIEKINKSLNKLEVISDSQYVVGLEARKKKLIANDFLTGKGTYIRNVETVKALLSLMDKFNIRFIKTKAHQKKGEGYYLNRYVDKVSRKMVRNYIKDKIDKL